MTKANEKLASLGLNVPEILLPEDRNNLDKWAVVACDQYSSDKDYWKKAEDYRAGSPSTLNLILPECYLDESEKRMPVINQTMQDYLDKGILKAAGKGFVYIDRSTPWCKSRKGLVAALDLEDYSYEKEAKCRIRPTEGTVLERLPVRAEIRKNAVLDLPHMLVLLDDPENKLFSMLEEKEEEFTSLYDFELADGAGRIKGSLVSREDHLQNVADLLENLDKREGFLFAVGDGNHSLGAAKQLWNKIKKETGDMNHPSRYALVELENIHDPGVRFEPIHRVLFDCSMQDFQEDFAAFPGTELHKCSSCEEMKKKVEDLSAQGSFAIGLMGQGSFTLLTMDDEASCLASEAFHKFLDPWLKKGKAGDIDYIHGEEVLKELSSRDGNLGFYLAGVNKKTFFDFIEERGPMPRKTFSIGEAEEKRYYLESRKLL